MVRFPSFPFCSSLLFNRPAFALSCFVCPPCFCRAKNDEDIKKHDERVTEAKEKFGEEEVFERLNHKAAFLARIGDNEGCLKAFEELAAAVKHLSTGQKVDVAMAKARLFLASSDWLKAKEKIQEAQE